MCLANCLTWTYRSAEKKRERKAVGGQKTGEDSSVVPADKGKVRYVRARPEIRKNCCLANLWVVES
jgi:hypothetical protein